MKKRNRMKLSRLFAGILVVLLFTGNTLTAFAHPQEEASEIVAIETQNVFIDEEGNVYIIEDDLIVPLLECNHNYIKGTYEQHTKLSNGGCIVHIYDAEMCYACSSLLLGGLISKTTYPVCIH